MYRGRSMYQGRSGIEPLRRSTITGFWVKMPCRRRGAGRLSAMSCTGSIEQRGRPERHGVRALVTGIAQAYNILATALHNTVSSAGNLGTWRILATVAFYPSPFRKSYASIPVGLKPDLRASALLCRSGFSPTPGLVTGGVFRKQTSSALSILKIRVSFMASISETWEYQGGCPWPKSILFA